MAQKTELQPYSLPGTLRSFVAKAEAGDENNHPVDWITTLQPYALPGIRRSFIAKAEAAGGFAYSQCTIIG